MCDLYNFEKMENTVKLKHTLKQATSESIPTV